MHLLAFAYTGRASSRKEFGCPAASTHKITLQMLRQVQPCFRSALIGRLELSDYDDAKQAVYVHLSKLDPPSVKLEAARGRGTMSVPEGHYVSTDIRFTDVCPGPQLRCSG